ncbi:Cof-type HAD-IIB family hydrolase [Bacillus sp. 2205SS5-2]|uniref:Cof-type HAD-IIB family hydrolase n=1 Tax=Bacillus sp. 2205SS5-2 TaxID=3109031 RepID=UPI003007B292
MIYRLLAINIDDTLIQPNGKISKETKEAIQYVQEKGIYVTLVTSRSFPAAKKVAKALKIKGDLITHQGAYISSEMGKPIYMKKLEDNITFDIAQFLSTFSCQIRLADENNAIMNKAKLPESLLGKKVWERDSRFISTNQYVDSISEYLMDNKFNPTKIDVVFEHQRDAIKVMKMLKGMYDEIDMFVNDTCRLEIVANGVSKLKGLMLLSEKLNIPRYQVVMIGVGDCDLPLIEWAGQGVAMGNASYKVKKKADWITRSNRDNGVAYMIKECFRKQQTLEFLKRMNLID